MTTDINIGIVIDLIDARKERFLKNYHKYPKYVKIPIWIYNLLKEAAEKYISNSVENVDTLCGLRVCETVSIKSIAEIEVF